MYCRRQLVELRDNYEDIAALDAEVLAVSTDQLRGARYSIEEWGVPFPVLYDTTEAVPKEYEVFNLHGDGLASASMFIIDAQGNLRYRFVSDYYAEQLSANVVIEELRKLA